MQSNLVRSAAPNRAYRPDIDGLRAVAIILVLMFHAFPDFMPGGFVGVDVFFVISGYLISSIIFAELEESRFSFLGFYARRVRRIFPALIVVLLATVTIGSGILLDVEFRQLSHHVIASTFFYQNFALLSEAGYFDRASDLKPLLHLWSLAVEEQFYITFPILVAVLYKYRLRLATAMALLVVVSFVLNIIHVEDDAEKAFYLPHLRAWELLAGSVLAFAAAGGRARLPELHRLQVHGQAGVGILLIVLSALLLDKNSPFPGWPALLPVGGAILLIAAGPEAWINREILSHRAIVFIGLISYPLYLWHWPILTYLRIYEGTTPSPGLRMLAVASSFALACLTYRILEVPVRAWTARNNSSLVAISLCGAMLCTACLGALAYGGYLDRYRPQVLQANSANFSWEGLRENSNCRRRYSHIESMFCNLYRDTAPTVVMLGDSHAMVFNYGLAPALAAHGGNLANIGGASCMPVFDAPLHSTGLLIQQKNGCRQTINQGIEMAEKTPSVSAVVLAGRRFLRDLEPAERDAVEQALRNTFARLTGADKRVVYVLDFPEPEIDPAACVRTWSGRTARSSCVIDVDVARARRQSQEDLVRAAARHFPDVMVFDPVDYLCTAKDCPVVRDAESLYIDRDHLSRAGSKLVAPELAKTVLR